jgi:hypothetical protein
VRYSLSRDSLDPLDVLASYVYPIVDGSLGAKGY